MRLSRTLSLYLGRQYLNGILVVFVVLGLIGLSADLIELLRRAASRPEATFPIVFEMAVLKLPTLSLKLLPFAALFGVMLTLTRLTRNNELAVSRAAGVSVWQFLLPGLVLASLLGGLVVTVFNPFAAATVARFEQMEAKYLRGRTSLLAVSETGVWLRQADPTGQSVVHALRVSQRGTELSEVIIFLYEGASHRFTGRIDAETAKLQNGYWELEKALLTGPNRTAEFHDEYRLATSLTLDQIQDSFASPETMSFWALPGFIQTLEAAGFSGLKHRLHWHSLLAVPLLLTAMVLIAATFSLRLTRRGGAGLLLIGGVLSGFLLFFTSDLGLALGLSGDVPVLLAAWTPAVVWTLLGVTTLLHLEDG